MEMVKMTVCVEFTEINAYGNGYDGSSPDGCRICLIEIHVQSDFILLTLPEQECLFKIQAA